MTRGIGLGILALLIFNALLTLALEVLFLPSYLGTWPFPVSAVAAALINVVLVLGARTVTDATLNTALPLMAWVAGYLFCLSAGPGGDVLLPATWPTLLLLVLGVLPPMWVLFTGAKRTI